MNNKGEVQLIYTLLISTLLLLIYLYFQYSLVSLKKMQNRATTYLCYSKYRKELHAFTSSIAKSNLSITALLPLTLIPQSSLSAKTAIKNLQLLQQIFLKKFQIKMLAHSTCHLSLKSILPFAHPYRTLDRQNFYRDKTEIAQLGKNEWQINLFGKEIMKPVIRLSLRHSSALTSRTQLVAEELKMLE